MGARMSDSDKTGGLRTEFLGCFRRLQRAPGSRKEENLEIEMLTPREDTIPDRECDSQFQKTQESLADSGFKK